MPAVVMLGAQWGDEGKGKIADCLAGEADMVVRYQGGANAGHTVVVDGVKYRLHLVPSGILHGKACVIGNGVALDPIQLVKEIDGLASQGIGVDCLHISNRATLVLPAHHRLDALEEGQRDAKIGTTGRGIGPAYRDKMARTALRVGDLLSGDLRERVDNLLGFVNHLLERVYEVEPEDPGLLTEALHRVGQRLRPHITDTSEMINDAVDRGQKVLFEGAQGTLLDIDHGTYPYVTSSNPTAGGACIGAGIGPTRISAVYGVVKAYTSRVGDGPFPTEMPGDDGHRLREKGNEYGTATGRPRRVGWLDAVALGYARRVNGLSGLIITRLDILSGFGQLKIATSYPGINSFPSQPEDLGAVRPEYVTMPGWEEDLTDCRSWDDLPIAARAYVDKIEQMVGAPVVVVSVGEDRRQIIVRSPLFPGK